MPALIILATLVTAAVAALLGVRWLAERADWLIAG